MDANPYKSPETTEVPPRVTEKWTVSRIVIAVVLIAFGVMLLACLFLPLTRSARPAAYRVHCSNNLKQIALALHNYADDHDGRLPPAYTVDANGKPLHSWRTLLLPYLEQKALYETIDLSKPWDDPANQQARESSIPTYFCVAAGKPRTETPYVVVRSAEGLFSGADSTRIDMLGDASGLTVLAVEVSREHRVHWMSPEDIDLTTWTARSSWKSWPHSGGGQVSFADAHVQFVLKTAPADALRAIVTIDASDNDAARREID